MKVCVPISVGSEMFAALTEMVLESPESEIKAAVGVKAAVIPQTTVG